jgi:hypothetical protein
MSPEIPAVQLRPSRRGTRLRPASPRSRQQVRTLLPHCRWRALRPRLYLDAPPHVPTRALGGLLHSLLRVDLFFLVLLFAITMYLRQVVNKNTRTILRALANTRQR